MLPKLKIIFQLQEHAPIVENGAPVIEIIYFNFGSMLP